MWRRTREDPLDRGNALDLSAGLLVSENYAEAETRMDDTMRTALPREKLAEVWTGIESQVGAFRKVQATRAEQSGVYTVVYVTAAFGTQTLDVKVAALAGRTDADFRLYPGLNHLFMTDMASWIAAH